MFVFCLVVLSIAAVILLAASRSTTTRQLQKRNQEWVSFLSAYNQVATTPDQKALLSTILRDIVGQGIAKPATSEEHAVLAGTLKNAAPAKRTDNQLDSTSLLLYFGAFLFVASVGLFVAFGGAPGTLRMLAVLSVTAVLYGSGLWLTVHRPKLQLAGLAFVGMGIVIAPLTGLACYAYVFQGHYGPPVWFFTSLLCLALYAYALRRLKKPLLNYILIFTFVSLFESAISVTHAPVYYFGWGLASVGLLIHLANYLFNLRLLFNDAPHNSSRLLLPLSILAAAWLIPSYGVGQLGLSFLFAAAYYGLEALTVNGTGRQADAVVSQVASIIGTCLITHGLTHNLTADAATVLTLCALQTIELISLRVQGVMSRNAASVLLLAAAANAYLVVYHHTALFVVTIGAMVIAAALWWKQQRADAYLLCSIAFVTLGYIYGQELLNPKLSIVGQTLLGIVSLVTLLAAYMLQVRRSSRVGQWVGIVQLVYVSAAVLLVVVSGIKSPTFCLITAILTSITMFIAVEFDSNTTWAEAASLILLLPISRSWDSPHALFASTVIGLAGFIAASLRYRRELLRWGSTALWLLLPVAFGRSNWIWAWTASEYAWACVFAMLGLVLSRAVARGVLFPSDRIPLASYARNASLSYVVGYCLAAVAAASLSLVSADSRVHTSAILAVLIFTVWITSRVVEKRTDTLSIIPILLQTLLLSVLRPHADSTHLNFYLLSSTSLAVATYAAALWANRYDKQHENFKYSLQTAVISAFVSPFALLLTGRSTWAMALGMLAGSILLLYHLQAGRQSMRELAGGLITFSLLWFLNIFHVREIQAYVHLVVAMFAAFSYWRSRRGELRQSDKYLMITIITATIPLAAQAIGGAAGGLYGWWLLLEEVGIMLLGIYIHKRFVIMFGLYVAVGAVLYQLRNLGWAALTVLALFILGIAVYRLQKHPDKQRTA